jgi:hypothetical protein
VHRPERTSLSKRRRVPGAPSQALLFVGVMGPAAVLLTGCSSGADLVSTVALPAEQQATRFPEGAGAVDMDTMEEGPQPATLELTDAQRAYLEALTGAGVNPSSQLRALSIGSSICQARAAGQSEQAVWDYVAPMVRSDVADAHVSAPQSAPAIPADVATARYLQIATQKLC